MAVRPLRWFVVPAVCTVALFSMGCRTVEETTGIAITHEGKLRQACDSGSAVACYELAGLAERDGADAVKVGDLLANACSKGSDEACEDAVRRVIRSPSDATPSLITALESRCGQEGGAACEAVYAALGASNLVRALAAAEKGCRRNVPRLCLPWAKQVSASSSAEPSAIRSALDLGCSAEGKEACGRLADMQAAGKGGKKDLAAAAASGQKACQDSAEYCWNAAEYGELDAWQRCAGSLSRASLSDVKTTPPELEQSEEVETTYYSTPTRYESRLRERGIIFTETYVETRAIPGRTYSYDRTLIGRYAYATVILKNDSCAPAKVKLRGEFDFGLGDRVLRGLGGAILGGLVATAAGTNRDDRDKAMLAGAAVGVGSDLHAEQITEVPAGEAKVVYLQVDTSSLFGRNRKMKSVKIEDFDVTFPGGPLCKPECLSSLTTLSGTAMPLRRMYERACKEGKQDMPCQYLRTIGASNDRAGLLQACNQHNTPNIEAACKRIDYHDWL